MLLRQLGIERVILTGIAADHCILASALNAHMRDFAVVVPGDCMASITPERNRNALWVMKTVDIEVMPAPRVNP